MDFGVTGINHKPLEVGGVDESLKQPLPDAFVTPPAKATMRVFPIAVIGRQVAPRSVGAKNPQDGIDKEAVVLGYSSPDPSASRQMSFEKFPGMVA